MSEQDKKEFSRRDFLKVAGAAGIGALVANEACADGEKEKEAVKVPLRSFGKTGYKVPALSLGGIFNIPSNQIMLHKAIEHGVTYWDTADCYMGGRSESGIGMYFKKYPARREEIFLVTKSDSRDPAGMTSLLDRSLSRMNTSYIDLYFIHGVSSIDELTPKTRAWAEQAKKDKKIRLFGFSTHSNMEDCMLGAAKLGWIDGIMMTYNYRVMGKSKMKDAVAACTEAGIGLTAMKTQGGRSTGEPEAELKKMIDGFLKKGFDDKQAKLLLIWENPAIASICSQMPNLTILMSNVSACVGKAKLSAADKKALEQYAQETSAGYCAGCTSICQNAIAQGAPIGDIMRYLMYYNTYDDPSTAKELFAQIPADTRDRLLSLDYAEAERLCPQQMPIALLMKEAMETLA